MIELLERTVMTAMGAVSLGQKKAEELLQELKQRFNVSEEEGKAFLTRMEETAKNNQQMLEKMAQEEVKKSCQRLGMVTEEEFDKLKRKVQLLEKKLKEMEK
jgi:polyhydroxyalkanoate synthesis regulator phasin